MLVADVPVKSGEEVECLCANNVLTVRLVESVRWTIILLVMFNHGICDVQTLLEANGNGLAEFDVNLMTVFLVKVKNAETLETNSVRQQLFDNLQPNLQPNLQLDTDVKVQDMEDRRKRLIISMDVYVLSTNELLQRYLSCNHLATMSRQAFAKSILKPAIDDGYVQMLYPDKPNHRGQKYKLTEKGLMILRKLI